MSDQKQPRSPRAASTAASEATIPGQVCATEGCGHVRVLHNLARDNRTRTACSVHSGGKGTPCGCRRFNPSTPGDPS